MSTRRKLGQLIQVATPQTVGDGRASRSEGARALAHRPTLPGVEGAVAQLVLAMAEAEAGIEGAPNRVRHSRKRLRKLVGDATTKEIELRARADRAGLKALRTTHEEARPRLFAAALEAVLIMREGEYATTLGRSAVCIGTRLRALGGAMLDAGSKALDPEQLRAGAMLVDAGRRELLFAVDVETRAKTRAREPAPLDVQAILSAHQAQQTREPDDDPEDDAPAPEATDAAQSDEHEQDDAEGHPEANRASEPAEAGGTVARDGERASREPNDRATGHSAPDPFADPPAGTPLWDSRRRSWMRESGEHDQLGQPVLVPDGTRKTPDQLRRVQELKNRLAQQRKEENPR